MYGPGPGGKEMKMMDIKLTRTLNKRIQNKNGEVINWLHHFFIFSITISLLTHYSLLTTHYSLLTIHCFE
jgi:hypothetical protein